MTVLMETTTTHASSSGAALELARLTKSYQADSEPAVHDVSLTVGAGEFVTLLGPSGSGKTTTLNMVAGFVPVTSGRVLIDGRDIADLPPHRRNLGFVFQNYALFPHMTVEDNIAYPLRRRRVERIQIRQSVERIMAVVELDSLAKRKPSELSGGQQQRVALARALVFQPRALLLDEPLAALDRQLRESLQDELRRLHRELGITILLVTHDQQEALHLSDRVAVFNRGRLEQVATPQDLYERPESLFVAQFFGESRMIHGVVISDGRVDADGWIVPAPDGHTLVEGSEAALIVRPESVHVAPENQTGRQVMGLRTPFIAGEAVIDDIVYRGSNRRVSLILRSGIRLIAIVPVRGDIDLRIGDRVTAGWDPADTSIVAGTPTSPKGPTA